MTYALGLNDAVNEGTSETSEELLRLRVAVGGTVLSNVLLVGLGSLDAGEISTRLRHESRIRDEPRRKQRQQ